MIDTLASIGEFILIVVIFLALGFVCLMASL